MSRKALFRTDASPHIGGGHVMRCLTLADELVTAGWTCSFSCAPETPYTVPALAQSGYVLTGPDDTSPCDLLVVDHYGLDSAYEKEARRRCGYLLVIDDLADRPHDCDMLVDQTYDRDAADYRDLVPDGCRILCGAEYALLRPRFRALREGALARRDSMAGRVDRLLISCGTTNVGNVTGFILRALRDMPDMPETDVVIGSGAASLDDVRGLCGSGIRLHIDTPCMAELMAEADLSIGAGGTTSWERCCLGLPSMILEMARNQSLITAKLQQAGAILNLGCYADAGPGKLVSALSGLRRDPAAVLAMSSASRQICDGRGTARIVRHLVDQIEEINRD